MTPEKIEYPDTCKDLSFLHALRHLADSLFIPTVLKNFRPSVLHGMDDECSSDQPCAWTSK